MLALPVFYDFGHRHSVSTVGYATAIHTAMKFFMEGFSQLRTVVVPFKRFGVRLSKSSDHYLQSDCLVFTSDIRLRVLAT